MAAKVHFEPRWKSLQYYPSINKIFAKVTKTSKKVKIRKEKMKENNGKPCRYVHGEERDNLLKFSPVGKRSAKNAKFVGESQFLRGNVKAELNFPHPVLHVCSCLSESCNSCSILLLPVSRSR